jgi:hypothetical protein
VRAHFKQKVKQLLNKTRQSETLLGKVYFYEKNIHLLQHSRSAMLVSIMLELAQI